MKLKLADCVDDEQWDEFVNSSPQGNVFCFSSYLKSLGERFFRYFVFDGDLPVLALPVMVEAPFFEHFASYKTIRFATYTGLMFSGHIESMPPHSRAPLHLNILEFALAELAQRHDMLTFCLHHSLHDLRAFQWFNYHNEALGRFGTHLRYTGLLPLEHDMATLHAQVRSVRRQEALKAEKACVTVAECDDVKELDMLLDLTFRRQGLERSPFEVNEMLVIARAAMSEGYGKCMTAKLPTGETASAVLVLYDRKTCYYLFAGNHPDFRKSGASSYLILKAIEKFKEEGKVYFDFIGINSPSRGDFKISFNANPTPYYITNWRRP